MNKPIVIKAITPLEKRLLKEIEEARKGDCELHLSPLAKILYDSYYGAVGKKENYMPYWMHVVTEADVRTIERIWEEVANAAKEILNE